jgi:hypothetical protein
MCNKKTSILISRTIQENIMHVSLNVSFENNANRINFDMGFRVVYKLSYMDN